MPSNAWLRFRYSLWAPHYDRVTKLHPQRRRSVELLAPRPGERLLIVGVGTGADLPHLPDGLEVMATDLTPAMLEQARAQARPGLAVDFRVMDGMALELPDGAFDLALLHMVLEVIQDPARCLAEVARVLRPGGRVAVFDKFLPEGSRPGLLRRAFLAVLDFVFTSTNRQMGEILARSGAALEVVQDEPAVGSYRHILLRKIRR
ncbi:MAG TPA: methyltransferase domain-containing protein [Thermoanaerobaculia bacterium]|jgi:ubiquinone/menaquinone biosynthesis C-methylase UbiE|nr:methyltransferase domain-containing protein [Thermoanaerobaculia bacterium]